MQREFLKERGLDVKVRESWGLLLDGLKGGLIAHSEAVEGLDDLYKILYPSSDVYRVALREIESGSGFKEVKTGIKFQPNYDFFKNLLTFSDSNHPSSSLLITSSILFTCSIIFSAVSLSFS